MTVDIATLGIKVDSSEVAKARDDLNTLAKSGGNAELAVTRMARQVDAVLAPLKLLQGLLAGLTTALGIGALVQYADTWKLIQARLEIVTRSTQELARAQGELFRIAQNTRSSLEGTAQLYTRVAEVATRAGRSQQDLFRFVETTTKGLRISGATAQEAQNAVVQLSQALASGALRGDEFNSLRENAAGFMQALADNIEGVDGNIGKLREFAEVGKLTFDVIFNAALKASDVIDRRFDQLPKTVGESWTKLQNAVLKGVGELDQAAGASDTLARGLSWVADNLKLVTETALTTSGALAAIFAARAVQGTVTALAGLGTSIVAVLANVSSATAGIIAAFKALTPCIEISADSMPTEDEIVAALAPYVE